MRHLWDRASLAPFGKIAAEVFKRGITASPCLRAYFSETASRDAPVSIKIDTEMSVEARWPCRTMGVTAGSGSLNPAREKAAKESCDSR